MNREKTHRFMEPLLNQWYGQERGEGEMLRFTPSPKTLSDSLKKISEDLFSPWELRMIQLKDSWVEIAGSENARRCRPASLNEGVLYIEVMHPAYRIILETPQIKQNLLQKIQTVIGTEYCSTIKFIVGGRTLR